jgi:hypothetical protein
MVDNAREDVLPNGRIRGILAADAPSKLTQGFWFTPNPTLLHRSISGLSGLGGLISTKTPLGLPGGLALLGLRLAILKTPDPEIHLPPSTDLKLAVSELPGDAPAFGAPPTPLPLPEDFAEWLTKQPHHIRKAPKKRAADIINFAFVGSRAQLDQAFSAAGWNTAEPLNRRTFGRTYKAFTMMRAYPTAPVSTLFYGNRAPDVVYQRSLNTLSKRHHIRVWSPLEGQPPEREVWLGAATHDVGIGFEAKRMSFNHRIDADIDVERAKIITDLNFAGCLRSVSFLDRPQLSGNSNRPRKSGIVTDGKVAVLNLADCHPHPLVAVAAPKPRGNAFSRTARRLALETRHHLLRGNVYFLGFRGLAWWFNTAAARNPGIQE